MSEREHMLELELKDEREKKLQWYDRNAALFNAIREAHDQLAVVTPVLEGAISNEDDQERTTTLCGCFNILCSVVRDLEQVLE